MKYIKLFFISVIVFGIMLLCISLLFPSNTIVSRATNLSGGKTELTADLPKLYEVAFKDSFSTDKFEYSLKNGEGKPLKYQSDLFVQESDTLVNPSSFSSNIHQGVALHELAGDSTALQVFYQIHVPWYQPWNKFGLMLNEAKYGPLLDSAISRIEKMR